ncbi:hypothetical protein BU17DRAFT_53628 [Hysterangium stoloniferum]|nr:hypothetical protein BU17DRAFT_53628 [Hysterangium stoloniferum]
MGAKSHNSLDIVLASKYFCLRGTGVDVQPCVIHGSVVLNLVEATTFKEITMQFRGKSRVPNVQGEGSVLGGGYQTQVITTHDWSFLECELTHTPTLKAGRHVFPFSLQFDENLPSNMILMGGLAGIGYKLRATAVRPGFSSNLHATTPVRILRNFAPEALEYQQTLELENTWPEKLMYSIMVPHKAWAAGDTVAALIKLSPLVKGVKITSITTSLQEHLKTYTRSGPPHDETRTVASAKYEIRHGHAVTSQNGTTRSPWATLPSSPGLSDGILTPISDSTTHVDPVTPGSFASAPPANVNEQSPFSESGLPTLAGTSSEQSMPEIDMGEEEIVTKLHLLIPSTTTPSHAIEPIVTTHRLRWNIVMSNLDGHVSELRCSLPVHILDHALLEDARAATRLTRRLLFGLDTAERAGEGEEMELPSYPAHIMDRVPDPGGEGVASSATGDIALDWVNTQLMMDRVLSAATTPPDSRMGSRAGSRLGSRASSPERSAPRERERLTSQSGQNERDRGHHHHHGIFSLKPFTKVASTFSNQSHSRQQSQNHNIANDSSSSSPAFPLTADTPPTAPTSSSLPQTPSASFTALPPFPAGASTSTSASPTGALPLNDTLSRVPHYDVASRGFLGGGVTPLSSMQGLPSYEEASGRTAERSFSDGDLAARFASALRR